MNEKTRKERKARWIRIKNDYWRYPDCVYGDAYCNHRYEPEYPWQWVDFRFLSKYHHRRYFAVAARCVRYEAYNIAEEKASDEADKDWQRPERGCYFGPAEKDPDFGIVYELRTTDEYREWYRNWSTAQQEYLKHFLQEPVVVRPKIEVRLEYGPVGVGVWAALNKDYLEPASLQEFILQFRELGEPLKQGIVWQGEEITVVPAEIDKRT